MKIIFRALILLLVLSGCDDVKVQIDPDDFGYPKVNVLAAGKNITGKNENQLSEWVDSGYQYNGDNLTIMVYNDSGLYNSVWSSWFGANEDILSTSMQGVSYCKIASPSVGDKEVKFTEEGQPPCIFYKGQGLYFLLTNPNSSVSDPNTYSNINKNPSASPAYFFTQGLWNPISMYSNNSPAAGYNGTFSNASQYIGGHAYFKILDKYYDDNSGGFNIALKRGFAPNQTPPITYVMNMITNTLNSTSETIFKKIIEDNDYLTALRLFLLLFMIIYGILFSAGLLNMSQKELFFTFLKLIVVGQLVASTSSWDLFNNYFFTFFTEGTKDMLAIITSSISGQTINGFMFFDNLLGLFFSYETSMKILALIVSVPSGIVVAGLLYASIAIFAISIVQGVVLYLLAFIATCLLIILGPIFISFMLFKQTRSLFESWINQFAVYFFQPVFVFGALALLSQMIISTMYKILGFGVCYQDYITLAPFGVSFVLMKAWQICNFSMNNIKDTIAVPGYGFWDSADPNHFCSPYECEAQRYIDLPFLDLVKDASLIKAFENPWIDLNTPMLFNAFILLLMSYLMYRFNAIVPSMGKTIAGGQGTDTLHNLAKRSSSDLYKFTSGTLSAAGNVLSSIDKYMQGKDSKDPNFYKRQRDKINSFIPSIAKSKPKLTGEEFDELYFGAKRGLGDLFNMAKEGTDKLGEKSKLFKYGFGALKLGYKATAGAIKMVIPPLSLSFQSKENEQNAKYAREKAAWKGEMQTKTPEAEQERNKLADKYEQRPGSIKSKMTQKLWGTAYGLGGAGINKFESGVGGAVDKVKGAFRKRNNTPGAESDQNNAE